ncbi:tumor necrosis factor receptor superfamily member 3-like, partial [Cetorhinus maximus]
ASSAVIPYDPVNNQCNIAHTDLETGPGLCCSKCRPGSYKIRTCTRGEDTQCGECDAGSYTEVWNFIPGCLSCRGPCKAELELIQLQECTKQTKRKCVCKPGTYCKTGVDESDTTCSNCWPHSPCPPGQGVRMLGNYSANTVCAVCTEGTFSNISSDTQRCQPHTDCSTRGGFTVKRGNSTTDTECQTHLAGPLGQSGENDTGPTSIPLLILSALLFLSVVTISLCLLQGLGKQWPLQLSCFKKVFKSCISDPEAQTTEGRCPDAHRAEQLLSTAESPERQALPPTFTSQLRESEILQERACEQDTAANMSTVHPGPSRSREEGPGPSSQTAGIPEKDADKSTGIIGPVFIYNPSRVYVGVISNRWASQRSLRAAEDTGSSEGTLRFPQEEQGTAERESGALPEQECGKESHLPESVAEEA